VKCPSQVAVPDESDKEMDDTSVGQKRPKDTVYRIVQLTIEYAALYAATLEPQPSWSFAWAHAFSSPPG